MRRKLLYRLHLWSGLIGGLFLALIGLTGSLLVFHQEIDRFLNPRLLHTEAGSSLVSPQTALEAAQRTMPAQKAQRIRLPQTPNDTYEIWFRSLPERRVYVDPHDGQVLGSRVPDRTLMGFIRRVHVDLLWGGTGRTIVGVLGLILMILVLSGPVLWWPGWRKVPHHLIVRRKHSWRAFHFQLHRVLGALTFIVLLFSAITGVCLVFGGATRAVLALVSGYPNPEPPPQRLNATGDGHLRLSELLATADRLVPDARTTWIWLPDSPDGVLTVRKRYPNESQPHGKTYVTMNPGTGAVVHVADSSRSEDVTAITNAIYPLHTGATGGLPMRLMILVTGAAPLLLFVTGVSSAWLRHQARRNHEAG